MNTNKREKRGKPVYTKQQQKLIKMGVRPGSREFGAVKMQAAPKPMRKFNLGGEAATSVGRATVRKSQTEARRKRVDDMLNRLYGPSNKPKPKPKPKKPLKKVLGDKIKPRLKKKPLKKRLKGAQESIMVLRLPKKKSKSPPRIGKKLQDYIDRNPLRRSMITKVLKIARSRKPTGVINIDDFNNVKATGVLAGTGFGKKTQSKGPAGKVMKKKRGGSIKK